MSGKTIPRWLRWLLPGVGALLLLALTGPSLISAYHLEAAGQQYARAPLAPQQALEHLQRAAAWPPNAAQAHWLAGQYYRQQGDWLAAIQALEDFTALRPNNPLGHIVLAQTCEAILSEMQAMRQADLIALSEQAEAQVPATPVDTPYDQPGESDWNGYIASATFSLPPNFGHRPALFMHAPSRISYTLTLPAEAALLRFGMGMDPQTLAWPGDGATFEVFVNGERVFLEYLNKDMARQGWHERTIDLAAWAVQEIILSLAVTPGPAADPSGDWAAWGQPEIIGHRLPELETQNFGSQLVTAWQRSGLTAADFVAKGEQARQAKDYTDALGWYRRAAWLEPDRGDGWYQMGLIYEELAQWPQALSAFEQAARSARLNQAQRGEAYYHAGLIYQKRLKPDQPAKALAAFEQALQHDPTHLWARIRLALAYYERDADAQIAEQTLLQAQALAPDNKWPCYYLGEIYRLEGRTDDAAAMYRQALQIDPDFEAAQERLTALEKQK